MAQESKRKGKVPRDETPGHDHNVGPARRVLILISDAGFGHRSAANAIAAALAEVYGSTCQVEIVNPLDDKRVPLLMRSSQDDYDRILREWPKLYQLGYQASDAAVPSAMVDGMVTMMLYDVMYRLIQVYQPDVIVTVHPIYQGPLAAVYTLRRFKVPLVTVVTDLTSVHRLWFNEMADLCLVPTEEARQLALTNGLAPERVQITGIPVNPQLFKDKRCREEVRAALGWRPDKRAVLAVGSKRVGRLPEALNLLNHSGLPVQLAVVAGGDDELYEQLQQMDWHTEVHLYNFTTDIPALMHASDCVLCKAGGLVVTESLACGLPLLLVDVLPGQETGNAEYVVKNGAGELAEDPVSVLESLCHWLDKDGARLGERSAAARALGRPRAAYEVADLVWQQAGRGLQVRHSRRRFLGRRKLADLLKRKRAPAEQ